MIRPINIKLNAAHPELPLVEATTFTGAPSSVFIRGVPKAVGNWSITAVNVAVTYPDNSTTTRAAVESAEGVWVATIPGTATSGRTVAGFRILADGIDENGAAVTGYVLGFADFAVLSFFPVPAPGETFFYLRYFDTVPTAAKKMDVTTIDGILKYYNGTAWLPFADLTNYYTKAETDNAIERVAAYYITYNAAGAAFPTRADLINATAYYSGGVVRVPTRNDYAVVLADETHGGAEWRYIYAVADGATTGQWEAQYPVEGVIAYDNTVTPNSGNGVKSSGIWSMIWGALASLPTGFASLYDWVVSQLAEKEPLFQASTASGATIKTVAAIVKDGSLLKPINIPTSGMAVNGKALTDDVTLTGADIPVDATQGAQKINAALADKANDNAVVKLTGDQVIAGVKSFYSGITIENGADIDFAAGGRVAVRSQGGSDVALFEYDRLEYSTDGGITWTSIMLDNIAPLASPAFTGAPTVPTPSSGDDSTKVATTAFVQGAVPYALVTKTISNNAVTLDDRASNAMTVSATLSPNTLTINFPTAPTGKLRDFAMRLNIAAGVTAPEIAWPQGVTLENNGGEVPEIADGGTGGSSTILYFSETENNGTTAKFLVKGETLTAIAQA